MACLALDLHFSFDKESFAEQLTACRAAIFIVGWRHAFFYMNLGVEDSNQYALSEPFSCHIHVRAKRHDANAIVSDKHA